MPYHEFQRLHVMVTDRNEKLLKSYRYYLVNNCIFGRNNGLTTLSRGSLSTAIEKFNFISYPFMDEDSLRHGHHSGNSVV